MPDDEKEDLPDFKNLGKKRVELLKEEGITSSKDIVELGLEGLTGTREINYKTAKEILESAKNDLGISNEWLEKNRQEVSDGYSLEYNENFEEGKEGVKKTDKEDFDLASEIEKMMGEKEIENSPEIKASKEVGQWVEENIETERKIGTESVCPICKSIVSVHDDRCEKCGIEFVEGKAKCSNCGELIETETSKCPKCGERLIDEKTLCPLCDELLYASDTTCPSCGTEVYEDYIRCADCKAEVPIDSVECPECGSILMERIMEEETPLEPSTDFVMATEESEMEEEETKTERVVYPFPAIVKQEKMKRALIFNAINSDIGGVLIEGQRGTAKSVAVRGLAEILPPIEVVKGCRFSCDPNNPEEWCWECRNRFDETSKVPVRERPVRVVDFPLSATEDRVVGTLDVEKILSEGEKAFEEGILAEVNRGILYIDEINLLDDFLVDVILDAAAMGQVTVERENISLTYPSNFQIVGSMNPEEGALRPQLLDRLALNVKVTGLPEPEDRIKIINRREEFDEDPQAFREKYKPEMKEMQERIIEAKKRIHDVSISDNLDKVIARLSVEFEVDGHRADIIMKRAARTNAAWEGRTEVKTEDIELAAEMALPHRMKKGPLEEKEFDKNRMKRLIKNYSR